LYDCTIKELRYLRTRLEMTLAEECGLTRTQLDDELASLYAEIKRKEAM
jgi:hypothetical protein